MECGTDGYERACRALEHSLNIAADAARAAGADSIYYLDGHGGGGNVNPDNIVSYCKKVDIKGWEDLIMSGRIDCQIELGAHARAGTIGGFLDHTLTSREWFSYRIGDKEYSELGIHAAFLGLWGVPVVLVSGDEVACRQAGEYVDGIFTAPVKAASERNTATDYEGAEDIIRRGVKEALAHYKEIKPHVLSLPTDITLTFYRTDMCENAIKSTKFDIKRLDARTIAKHVEKNDLVRYSDFKF
jgi:D-amino peptidase